MTIPEIKIDKFPVIIFTDSHADISSIIRLKELYPTNQFICLGDITFLFSKPGETYNTLSIQYFIDHKIPTLLGNHEQHILSCSTGNSLRIALNKFDEFSHFTDEDKYNLTQQHIDYLKSLPIGFKLILPNKTNYLLFHHAPDDLWSHYDENNLTENEFREKYSMIDENTLAIIHGHLHKNFTVKYPTIKTKRISVGQLCVSDHHTKNENGKNYALLTEKGIEFKKL